MMNNRQDLFERFRIHGKHKEAFNRLVDKYEQVKRNHTVVHTDFMNPETVAALMPVMTTFQDVNFKVTGGYVRAEYQIVILFPDYLYVNEDEIPLKVVRIIPKDSKHELEHRDVLGSVLGIGIKRDKTGDILMHDGFYQMVVLDRIADVITSQMDRVGKTPVETCVERISDIVINEEVFETAEIVVASERLDAMIAGVWHISRGKAADLIKADKVKVNYQLITSSGHSLKEEDMVSCRGKGRFYYDGILNKTRKDRIRVQIRKVK